MKIIFLSIAEWIKKTVKWIWLNILSISALMVAIITFNSANEQFKKNSKDSDFQFKTNLKLAKEQFDSISSQLKTYKTLTEKQIQLVDDLLKINKQTFNEKVYSERPFISIEDLDLADKEKVWGDLLAPQIAIVYSNNGKRPCYDILNKIFLVSLDGEIRNSEISEANELGVGKSSVHIYLPKLGPSYINDFFLVVIYDYQDIVLNKKFEQKYFFHYKQMRNKYAFFDATYDERKFLSNLIPK